MIKIKNFSRAEVVDFKNSVTYNDGQIVSRTLAQNPFVSLTLFAFDKGEEISSHASKGDALVLVLDGKAKITIGEKEYQISEGESILMPSNINHAVEAIEKFKMLLTVVF